MELGVFIPIANNGWLVSTTAPQYEPSFDLNRELVQRAEHYGLEFALSMVRYRGLGGVTEFWDHSLESFTLMAALAACTERIKLYASSSILTVSPMLAAKMAVTIDSVAPGRFGINIVTGWQRTEFAAMGLWPGDEHYERRYDVATEYVTVLRDFWTKGLSNFKGDYYQFEDCPFKPLPSGHIELVCAGQSNRGVAFCAEHGDVNFVVNTGVNTPTAHSSTNERVLAAAAKAGRNVGTYVLVMLIAAETDEAAQEKWELYHDGIDLAALSYAGVEASADTNSQTLESSAHLMANAKANGAVNMGMGALVGSYESVARMLDEMAALPGTRGIMLVFDEFISGMEIFGERIQPLMSSRRAQLAHDVE